MSNLHALFESDVEFEKRVVAEAENFYDTSKDIRKGCALLSITRQEYIHRYALTAWAQRPRVTTSVEGTSDWLYVHGAWSNNP